MEFHRPERRGSRPSSSDLRGGPTLAPSARCSWDRRRRLKTKCFLRRGVCPQGALAAVAIIPGAPASPGGRLILVGSARSPSRLARAGGVYRGRPPFGDRRSARGCSGAVPERRVPKRPTRQCRGKKESLQDTTRLYPSPGDRGGAPSADALGNVDVSPSSRASRPSTSARCAESGCQREPARRAAERQRSLNVSHSCSGVRRASPTQRAAWDRGFDLVVAGRRDCAAAPTTSVQSPVTAFS